jgi:hypothetical protein
VYDVSEGSSEVHFKPPKELATSRHCLLSLSAKFSTKRCQVWPI